MHIKGFKPVDHVRLDQLRPMDTFRLKDDSDSLFMVVFQDGNLVFCMNLVNRYTEYLHGTEPVLEVLVELEVL